VRDDTRRRAVAHAWAVVEVLSERGARLLEKRNALLAEQRLFEAAANDLMTRGNARAPRRPISKPRRLYGNLSRRRCVSLNRRSISTS
jgi:hypothetical protein